MKKIKVLVFCLSVIGSVVYLLLIFSRNNLYDYCFAQGHCWRFWESLNTIGALLFLFPFLFLLSLITYKMRDEVFEYWWNFAKWWVPIIILVTYLQSTQGGGGGLGIGGAISGGFDILVLSFFYAVLIIVSLRRIVKKYRQLKREGK